MKKLRGRYRYTVQTWLYSQKQLFIEGPFWCLCSFVLLTYIFSVLALFFCWLPYVLWLLLTNRLESALLGLMAGSSCPPRTNMHTAASYCLGNANSWILTVLFFGYMYVTLDVQISSPFWMSYLCTKNASSVLLFFFLVFLTLFVDQTIAPLSSDEVTLIVANCIGSIFSSDSLPIRNICLHCVMDTICAIVHCLCFVWCICDFVTLYVSLATYDVLWTFLYFFWLINILFFIPYTGLSYKCPILASSLLLIEGYFYINFVHKTPPLNFQSPLSYFFSDTFKSHHK